YSSTSLSTCDSASASSSLCGSRRCSNSSSCFSFSDQCGGQGDVAFNASCGAAATATTSFPAAACTVEVACTAEGKGCDAGAEVPLGSGPGCGDAAADATACSSEAAESDPWDTSLHLPLWISSNERAQIERRLDGWVDALLRVGADVEGLAKVLRKPLRPLWISQASTIWLDQVAQPDQLPFTPLYLVSASQPQSYLRQVAAAGAVAAAAPAADGDTAAGGGGSASQRRRQHHPHTEQEQQHAWTYVYVPGAGDDEESWAAGLTPAVFWAHYPQLLQAGPGGVHDTVRQLLQREAADLAEHGTNSSITAAAAAATIAAGSGSTEAASSKAAAATSSYIAATDEHHLLPAGCRAGGGATAVPVAGPCGMYWLGPGTRIALGDLAAGAAPGCWRHVDAVLSCGEQQHPSMAG
ncbi:hypothetical protein Agub_g4461, partial [Astrephomene gubernaculifera]